MVDLDISRGPALKEGLARVSSGEAIKVNRAQIMKTINTVI